MAERPNQNWEARDIWSMPSFRVDTNNPQMGYNGTLSYAMYCFNQSNDQNLTGLTESGSYRIYNDRCVEIVAGNKSSEDGVDIVLTGMGGDITITAMRNGSIRIKGKNITIEADEDVDIKAGRNITTKSGSGRVLMQGNVIDAKGLSGNVVEKVSGGSFGTKVFDGSYVGLDDISRNFAALASIPVITNSVDNTTTSEGCQPTKNNKNSNSGTSDLDAELDAPITDEFRQQVRTNTVPGVNITNTPN
jgi:hypothetical protein